MLAGDLNGRLPRALRVVEATLVAVVLGCVGCSAKPPAVKSVTSTPVQPAVSAQTRAAAAAAAQAHPSFKVFLQKLDMPAIVVVPETTTEEELKGLLWFLRTKVRAGQFRDLGLQSTASQYGKAGFVSGVINIYRGSRCAKEMYVTLGPDPCGPSIHKAASYHWGDGEDPHLDGADLVAASGATVPVFDASDGWRTDAELAQDPDGSRQRAASARIRYAVAETAKQSKSGSDLRFFIDQPSDELSAVSYQFNDEAGQKRFVNQYVFLEQEHLCAAGFRTVRLGLKGAPGTSYPISCSPLK